MIRTLRKRFILFSCVVISCIIIIIGLFVFIGSSSDLPAQRYVITLALAIVMVFIGSWLLSKIAIRPVQAAWQKQLDFTADASHELRTPLAVMRTNLELVMDNPQETVESQMKWLENVRFETVRMATLVDDLLTISRGDADTITLEYSSFILNSVVEETALLFETTASQKGIEIKTTLKEEIQFYGDFSRMRQLLGILVDNAIKYMKRPGCIEIDLAEKDNSIQLSVADTGEGIAPEHLSRLFNRFYRAGNDQQDEGFGLGLAIAEWIVKEHKGRIQVESTVGAGTLFIMSFPLKN